MKRLLLLSVDPMGGLWAPQIQIREPYLILFHIDNLIEISRFQSFVILRFRLTLRQENCNKSPDFDASWLIFYMQALYKKIK